MFRDCIKEVLDDAGAEALENKKLFDAYLSDIATDFNKETQFFLNICDDKYLSYFANAECSKEGYEHAAALASGYLIQDKITEPGWAESYSDEFGEGVYLHFRTEIILQKEDLAEKEKPSDEEKPEERPERDSDCYCVKKPQPIPAAGCTYKTGSKAAYTAVESTDALEKERCVEKDSSSTENKKGKIGCLAVIIASIIAFFVFMGYTTSGSRIYEKYGSLEEIWNSEDYSELEYDLWDYDWAFDDPYSIEENTIVYKFTYDDEYDMNYFNKNTQNLINSIKWESGYEDIRFHIIWFHADTGYKTDQWFEPE